MPDLTIGRVAKLAGVGVETIRFYQREGLLAVPERRQSGYRHYSPDVVDRVRFIRHAKGLGFTLKEVSELLELRVNPILTCDEVRERAARKVADIDSRIASLEKVKAALVRLGRRCQGRGPTSECPILEELNRDTEYTDVKH